MRKCFYICCFIAIGAFFLYGIFKIKDVEGLISVCAISVLLGMLIFFDPDVSIRWIMVSWLLETPLRKSVLRIVTRIAGLIMVLMALYFPQAWMRDENFYFYPYSLFTPAGMCLWVLFERLKRKTPTKDICFVFQVLSLILIGAGIIFTAMYIMKNMGVKSFLL